jgi:hypothetical protein
MTSMSPFSSRLGAQTTETKVSCAMMFNGDPDWIVNLPKSEGGFCEEEVWA